MEENIFNLTEITQLIASFLAPADLFNSCQVSKQWFVPFASELWRSIKSDQWTQGGLSKALPRYSHYIRELECSRYTILDSLSPECTQLKYFKAPAINLENIDTILPILQRNPNLEKLVLFSDMKKSSTARLMEVVNAMLGLSKLKSVSLSRFTVEQDTMKSILSNLVQLEELHLERYNELMPPGKTFSVDTQPSLNSTADGGSSQQTPTTRALRSLHLEGSQLTLKDTLEIIRYTPQLKSLYLWDEGLGKLPICDSEELNEFCEGLANYCPELTLISLDQNEFDTHGLSYLLNSIIKLKSLELGWLEIRGMNDQGYFSKIMLECLQTQENLKETLEELKFINVINMEMSFCPPDLLLGILEQYPAMRKLEMEMITVSVDRLLRWLDDGSIEFVCKDLEVLKIGISGDHDWIPPIGWERKGNDDTEECDDEYKDYYTLIDYLSTMPKLDLNSITFVQD